MGEHEFEIREVPVDSANECDGGEWLHESAAEVVGLAIGAGGLALEGLQTYYARQSLRREDDKAQLRREFEDHVRMLHWEFGGLDALDAYDLGDVRDDLDGFGVD